MNSESSVTVGSTATTIIAANPKGNGTATFPRSVLISNTHATDTLYVGFTDGVTAANGTPVAAGGSIAMQLMFLDEVWGIRGGAADIDARVLDLHA